MIVIARKKYEGKQYEVSVDFEEAMKVKAGTGDITRALNSNGVFYDINKGNVASNADLQKHFGTTDTYQIALKIIKEGEVQKPQEFRNAEREAKVRELINLVIRNAVDQHGRPYTEDRIKRGIDEVHYNIDNRPAQQQLPDLIEKLKVVIPIRIETKKIGLVIPARFSGQVYGLLKDYKESEDWQANGDLKVILNIPAGMQIDFYEKLNNVTHGSVVSEEIK